MIDDIRDVDGESLLGEVVKFKRDGFRLVTLTAVWADADHLSILYHFDRDFKLRHLRLTTGKNGVVPSITPVCFAAFLPENEIQDGFGVRFTNLCIDYGGLLFMQTVEGPPPYAAAPMRLENKGDASKGGAGAAS